MAVTNSRIRDELVDREAIRDCIYRYSRGIDRGDEAMLRSCYWPDATDDHAGLFAGAAADYVDNAVRNTAARCPTMHFVTNPLIGIDGDRASVESYYYAVHEGMEIGGAVRDLIATGRYMDRFGTRLKVFALRRAAPVKWRSSAGFGGALNSG